MISKYLPYNDTIPVSKLAGYFIFPGPLMAVHDNVPPVAVEKVICKHTVIAL